MSLTDAWKARKLQEGFYYVRSSRSPDIEIRYVHNNCADDYEEILVPVPSYEELKKLKRDNETYIHQLETMGQILQRTQLENKNLKNKLEEALRDASYFELEAYSLKQDSQKNSGLKELLKECKPYISYKINKTIRMGYTPDDANLLTRIDAAIGESEE